MRGLARVGGIIALFNISILLTFMHEYKFSKEINKELTENALLAKDKEHAKQVQKKIYSIENFNILIRRIQQLEKKTELFMVDKKINWF